MKTKELLGVGKTTFKIVLSEDWQSGEYILGCDPYEKENVPINLYHKIRKFFRLKFKILETKSKCVIFKKHSDGTIEYIK